MPIAVRKNEYSLWIRAAFVILVLLTALNCQHPKISPLQRIEAALNSAGGDKAMKGCQEYFENSAAKELNSATVENMRSRCAAAFIQWFIELPDELDSATIDRISKMTWMDVPSGGEAEK